MTDVPLPLEPATVATLEPVARKHGLDPCLVLSVVVQESSGRVWAWNPEPRYPYLWDVGHWRPFRRLTRAEVESAVPPPDFPVLAGDRDQEWWGQRASWGLMQVMGAVGREHGFRGRFLTELLDPWVNAEFGCRHLKKLIDRWGLADGISAYNAGSPTLKNDEAYTRPVLKRAEEMRRAV